MDQAVATNIESQLPEVSLAFEVYGDDAALESGVGGSVVRLRLGPYQLLLDCSKAAAQALITEAEQQEHEWQSFNLEDADPPIDFVCCSHVPASAQGLQAIHQVWPELPILASQATHHLLPLICPELEGSIACQALPWQEPLALMADLSVELFPAGYLPGAAVIVLTYYPSLSFDSQFSESETASEPAIRVAYFGGAFLSGTRCVGGLNLNLLRGLGPDLLIAECAYGVQRYPRRKQQENDFVEQLLAALAQGRSVLMPVSAFGIAQEIILLLRSHYRCTGQKFDIWVDEPVAEGCDRYLDLLDEMPVATQNFARRQALFWDERVRPCVYRFTTEQTGSVVAVIEVTDSADSTVDSPEKASAQTMEQAGRPGILLVHLESDWGQIVSNREVIWELWLDRTAELLPNVSGWAKHPAFAQQSAASLKTLTAHLQTGRLHLSSYRLTDSCDGMGITQIIHNLRPQNLLLGGSSSQALQQLSELEELRRRYRIHIGEPNTKTSLITKQTPPKRSFVKPASAQRYSADLLEDSDNIRLQIDSEIALDPRWQAFAETGLLEVEWQAEGLLIRGLSPQALRERDLQKSSRRQPSDTCQTCAFYQNWQCCNPASPLVHIQVPADGYCEEFQYFGMIHREKS